MGQQMGALEKGGRWMKAVGRWIKAGRPVRSDEQVQRIFEEICRPCEQFDPRTESCRVCGCRTNSYGGPLRNKIAMQTERCPKGKWSAAAEVVEVEIGGGPFFVPSSSIKECAGAARSILNRDEYRLRPIEHAGHKVRTVVDAGANCGAFSLMAGRLFPQARILAFEPNRDCQPAYRKNMELLEDAKRVVFHPVACLGADESQSATLRVLAGFSGSSFLHQHKRGPFGLKDRRLKYEDREVAGVRISKVLEAQQVQQVDILKIDTEGSEAAILRELSQTGWLERVRWIRLEWHGLESRPEIEQLLDKTHVCHLGRRWRNLVGPGIAHNRRLC